MYFTFKDLNGPLFIEALDKNGEMVGQKPLREKYIQFFKELGFGLDDISPKIKTYFTEGDLESKRLNWDLVPKDIKYFIRKAFDNKAELFCFTHDPYMNPKDNPQLDFQD